MSIRDGQLGLALFVLVVTTTWRPIPPIYRDGGWSTGPRHITGCFHRLSPLGSGWILQQGNASFVLLCFDQLALGVSLPQRGCSLQPILTIYC